MVRRKSLSRRTWTPRADHDDFDGDDARLDGFDLDAELGALDELLGDPLDQVVMAIARPPRPIRARIDELRSQPLTRLWCARADDCGAGGTRRERGIDYLVHGAVLDLQVGPRRLAATVQGTRRYRVDVAIILPRKADMQATLQRARQARGAATGPELRSAVERAILSGGAGQFPSPSQIHGECSCPDGSNCKHVVAAVYAFGVLLASEPEQLLSLWDLDTHEPQATAAFVLPPLAADKTPLPDDLSLFGIDLIAASEPATPRPAIAAPLPEPEAPAPAPPEPAPAPTLASPPSPAPGSSTPNAAPPPSQQAEVRRDYLRFIGVPTRTIDAWLRSGILIRTDRAGVYERTAAASREIAEFLAR